MRKTIRNGVNRRAVYKFNCSGCGKHKSSYVYKRAKKGVCYSCERNKPDENQLSLIPMSSIPNKYDPLEPSAAGVFINELSFRKG